MNLPGGKWLKIGASLALLVIAGGMAWYLRSHAASATRYETTPVSRGRVIARVTATGTLSALVTVQVGSQISGRISDILVDFNSPVRKGQVLARIDSLLLDAAVEQARANGMAAQGDLATAKAHAVDAQRQYVRARDMRAQSLIAQADVDTAQANAEAAQAQVASAEGHLAQVRAALRQAQVNLGYATIASPTDGVVVSRNVDVGQTVAASLQAPTLFLIAQDLRRMQVDTSVAEADVGHLQAGMKATFTVDAYPGEQFTGTVRQVRDSPQIVQNVVTYDAVIDVSNDALKLKPGMTANVTFVYADRDNVIRVPNSALRFRPPTEKLPAGTPARPLRARARGEHRTVWALRADKPVAVDISTGVTDGSYTEVTRGDLTESDLVITEAVSTAKTTATQAAGANPFRRGF
jgi:HlyD family secretion protein